VSVKGASVSLTESWKLASLQAPLAPLVINNLAFVLSSGDSGAKRAPAVLYALDGNNGKVLWASGKTITTHVPRSSAIWNSMGQVLVGAADSTLYAFGMNMDRHL
jgi:outer membrane protein assembly factor BamB